MKSASEVLKFHFERKKKSKPGFSVRNFAKSLGVSASFMSAILNGKKPVPINRLEDICKLLELDGSAFSALKKTVIENLLGELGLESSLAFTSKSNPTKSFVPVSNSHFSILSPWYNIPIMDLSTCDHFQKDPRWIAAQLGLTCYQVTDALRKLVEHGLLIETEQGYQKVESKIRLSLNSSHAEIRKFHYQMIEKAQEELAQKVSNEAFEKREISGITIAANPKNVSRARQVIVEAIHEAAEILSEGECTDLYQINTQLFSLLKGPNRAG